MATLRPAATVVARLSRILPRARTTRLSPLVVPAASVPRRCLSGHASEAQPGTSSVNAEEISHFDALASEWWDPHGSSRALHLMNPLRHDFIRTCHESQPDPHPIRSPPPSSAEPSASPSPGLRYLDVGCGGGIFAESAARLPTTASVTALDASAGVLAVARAHARRDPSLGAKLHYHHGAIETLPPPRDDAAAYDVVSLFEVVEHVDSPAAFLDRCGAFVRPGGWLVLSTIARTWTSWLTTNVMAEDVLRIVPKGTHDWHKYINEDELRAHFAARPGWSSPRCMGVVYVPGLGWKEVNGSEKLGNYFFAVRKDL